MSERKIGRVISVHAGALASLSHADLELPSGIFKAALSGPVRVGVEGIDGDRQGDTIHHGGPDRALCVYPLEHLAWLAEHPAGEPGVAPCGENLSTEGLIETDVAIGDRFRIGEVLVEISVPRNPCHRLADRHGARELPVEMERSGRTGFFFRVLSPGRLTAGDPILHVESPHAWATVAEANRLMHRDRLDHEGLRAMVALPPLASSWRATFARRLSTGVAGDSSSRLYGA